MSGRRMGKRPDGKHFHLPRESATKRGIIRSALVKVYLEVHMSSFCKKDAGSLLNLTCLLHCCPS